MIKKIKWNDPNVLGNLVLDFSKPGGGVYNTIVIAGENGTGKTNILETLSTFLNLGTMEPFSEITYEINGSEYRITPLETYEHAGFHNRTKLSDGTSTLINSSSPSNVNEDPLDIRHYGCAYTKARSGFSTKPIKSTTTEQLDNSKFENDESDDYTKTKQLLIDIKMQDDSAWARKCSTGTTMTYLQFCSTSKTYRFQNAFNNFFETLQYIGIDGESASELNVLFSKNSKSVSIDRLSTGEKQVVYRGAHLLKNSNNLEGGAILIDEPELSMHPKWQEKVFEYYRGLFLKNGIQTTQIFFATHSEYVVRSALRDPDNVLVIILSDHNGTITSDRINNIVLPTTTAAEVNYLAFDIKSIDYHIALYGDLQVQTSKSKILEMDRYIELQPEYDATIHEKDDNSTFGHYKTLPTYIRNAIDHPDSGRNYSEADLETSIKLLRVICKRIRSTP